MFGIGPSTVVAWPLPGVRGLALKSHPFPPDDSRFPVPRQSRQGDPRSKQGLHYAQVGLSRPRTSKGLTFGGHDPKRTKEPLGCGSKTGTQNGTLLNGNND